MINNIPNIEDLEKFLDNSAIGVHIVSSDGTVLWANKSELNFLGHNKEEYFGKSIIDFHVDKDVISAILTLLSSGEELKAYPARLRARDGSIEHVLINSNVYQREGDFIHTRCFTTRIPEVIYDELRSKMN